MVLVRWSWSSHQVTISRSKIHVTISKVYVLCNIIHNISIFRFLLNLILCKLNLIDMCAWLVSMASVNAGSPCEIHRTDPCIDSKIYIIIILKVNTHCKPHFLSSCPSAPLSVCYFQGSKDQTNSYTILQNGPAKLDVTWDTQLLPVPTVTPLLSNDVQICNSV